MQNFDGRESFLIVDDVFVAGYKSIKAHFLGDVEVDDFVSLYLE